MDPIFDTTRTKEIIEYRLSKAEKSIDIAMAWFTDTDLSAALMSVVKSTVKIRVMLQDDDINRNSKINWNVLCSKNIELYWYKAESALMHHKFCVIDKRVCLFGTYNWTFKAAKLNEETFFETENVKTAAAFELEFLKILKKPITQLHKVDLNAIPVTQIRTSIRQRQVIPSLAEQQTHLATIAARRQARLPETNNVNQLTPRNETFLQALKETTQTLIKSKPYTAYITRSTPSVFLFLIDQSGSMDAKVTLSDGKIVSKAEFLSNAVNDTLNELLNRCIKGNDIRDYFEVAVIGYGGKNGSKANMAWEGALANKSWVKMTELASHFLSEDEIEVIRPVRGKDILSKVKRKKWITPLAEYQTPMNHAFGMATDLLEDWIVRYKGQNVYPPTVINITDGQFTDASNAEMLTSAQRIMDLKTMDGNVLLFNLHISTKATTEVIFPYKREELPENDAFARVLFDMSSDLPDVFNLDIAKLRGIDSMQSFTGMAYNASLDKLVVLMNIGTSTTTRQIQQPA